MAGINSYNRKKSKLLLVSVFVMIFIIITSTVLSLRFNAFSAIAKEVDSTISIDSNASNTNSSGKSGIDIVNVNSSKQLTAPGRVNTYVFNVVNNESFKLKFEAKSKSQFINADGAQIPIEVRMLDHNGNYCVGGEDEWVPAEEMDAFTRNTVLAPNSYAQYTLEWRWPYESGNDELDTKIGKSAIKQTIMLEVEVDVVAERASASAPDNGIPYTGDSSNLILWITVAAVSFAALFVLLVFNNRRENDDEKIKRSL